MKEISSEVSTGAFNQDQISAELLNLLPFPLFLIDQENRFVWLNPAAENFFKSSTAYLAGHAVVEFIPSDSPFLIYWTGLDRPVVLLLKGNSGWSARSWV